MRALPKLDVGGSIPLSRSNEIHGVYLGKVPSHGGVKLTEKHRTTLAGWHHLDGTRAGGSVVLRDMHERPPRRSTHIILATCLFFSLAGCSSSPTSPTPPPVVVTPPPPVVVTPPAVTPPVVVTPPPNPLLSDPRFSLSFYRQMTQDGFERPASPRPLSRWTRPPLIYLQTIDDRNAPVDARLLDQTAAALINTTALWTGGAFGVAGLERGTGTREGQPQWITVKWSTSGVCGTSGGVGLEAISITMNWRRPECTCGPLVAKHELGHVLGYWHTDSPNDLMVATFQGICDKQPSDRELFHAKVAYSQVNGSLDPK
jgi:hypothetical protein